MAMKTTRWTPDTCGCVLEYSWDDALRPDQRVHSHAQTVRTCAAHSGASGAALMATVVGENQRKNQAFALAQEIRADLQPDDYRWIFRPDRTLEVEVDRLTLAERTALTTELTARLGSGVVVRER